MENCLKTRTLVHRRAQQKLKLLLKLSYVCVFAVAIMNTMYREFRELLRKVILDKRYLIVLQHL